MSYVCRVLKKITTMRHFATKKEAIKWRDQNRPQHKIFKKLKGHKNRVKKPFVVGTELEWLNLY